MQHSAAAQVGPAMPSPATEIDWKSDRVPVSRAFGDPYYSLDNGLAEARHVFLAGNGLPERFREGFRIAEIGVGTGLNLCAALAAWRASGQTGRLYYTGFEAYPLSTEEMARALSVFAELRDVAASLIASWEAGGTRIELADLSAEIVTGDARAGVPRWHGRADAWFLDGFAPARNPELWEPALMRAVAARTAPGGTCATFTAAGCVRRALAEAGFAVRRVPGFGRKRHMTVGRIA